MTRSQKHLDAGELSLYSEDTYTAAEIYGDASLLGRTDINYEPAVGTLEEHPRTEVFESPQHFFKNIWSARSK